MDDKVKDGVFDDEGVLFPETETRRLAEKYAPVSLPRAVGVEGVRAIEQALRRPPAPEARHPLLAEREHTHGNFDATALIAQRFKDVARNTPNWGSRLTDVQREALEGVFTKVARILSGDPNHKDHWSDVAGGAHLVEERL
jgi:hypothetical protein